MSYHRYITDAFVLGARQSGEASRRVVLLTRSCGVVSVHAQSVRLDRSRLRPHLPTHALLRASLVRGREIWRLVGALPYGDGALPMRAVNPFVSVFLARLACLVRRLVPEDAPDEQLFEHVVGTARFLSCEELEPSERAAVEAMCVARVLFRLGYLDRGRPGVEGVGECGWDRTVFPTVLRARAALVDAINEALEASHL